MSPLGTSFTPFSGETIEGFVSNTSVIRFADSTDIVIITIIIDSIIIEPRICPAYPINAVKSPVVMDVPPDFIIKLAPIAEITMMIA